MPARIGRKKAAGKPVISASADRADLYGLYREEPNFRRNGGWGVGLRRQGRPIRRLFKDSVYGSEAAAFAEACAYRDAVVDGLPPRTNHQQAVKLRTSNKSGISGVRRGNDRSGIYWGATLLTLEGQKVRRFSVKLYGEDQAKSLAIAQRQQWLTDLPAAFLVHNANAEAATLRNFGEQLTQSVDVLPQKCMTPTEIEAQLADINARFDARRPRYSRTAARSMAIAWRNLQDPAPLPGGYIGK